jgi:hypothetical protein
MKEVGKRRGIFYCITRTFTSRDWATRGIRQPNNLDQSRDFKKWQSNSYAAILRFCIKPRLSEKFDLEEKNIFRKPVYSGTPSVNTDDFFKALTSCGTFNSSE